MPRLAPVVRSTRRRCWAAGAVFLLGSPGKDRASKLLAFLGVAALALWAVSTLRHARRVPQTLAASR
jgi:hypothetical protein